MINIKVIIFIACCTLSLQTHASNQKSSAEIVSEYYNHKTYDKMTRNAQCYLCALSCLRRCVPCLVCCTCTPPRVQQASRELAYIELNKNKLEMEKVILEIQSFREINKK